MAVRDLGPLNAKDRTLLDVIRSGDWVLVTGTVDEFRRRYATQVALHAGRVFLAGVDAGRDVHSTAWRAALEHIAGSTDPVNIGFWSRASRTVP